MGSELVKNDHSLARVRSRVTRYKSDIYIQEELQTLIPTLDDICLCVALARSGRDALSTRESTQRNGSQERNEKSVHLKAHR